MWKSGFKLTESISVKVKCSINNWPKLELLSSQRIWKTCFYTTLIIHVAREQSLLKPSCQLNTNWMVTQLLPWQSRKLVRINRFPNIVWYLIQEEVGDTQGNDVICYTYKENYMCHFSFRRIFVLQRNSISCPPKMSLCEKIILI